MEALNLFDAAVPEDVVAFPEGPAVANRTGPVRVAMLSTKRKPRVSVYPDSDKLAVWQLDGPEADELIVRRSAGTDYRDGETP